MENYFTDLAKIDVREHTEKKGQFSYLSWAWAVDVLRKKDPTATWEVLRFNGMPFMETKYGIFVEVAVTVQGITLSQIHPVLNNNNKPIAQPNSFEINTSIQRCLVKAIALHGLGLYIYAGEDLPEGAEEAPTTPEQPKEINWKEKNEQSKNAAQEVGQQKLSEALQRDVMGLMKKRNMGFPDLNEFCTAMLERPVKFFKKDVVDVAELKKIKAAMDDAVGA
ncbi:DUF1071 domain-containing protein [Paenibacillus sp. LjRoot56]|uniref:Sak single strand annealing protein n=1 Tax=Paenibacillus sp. LjRoot56 TaxID=3342333 RepID=UPI003ECEFC30